MGEKEIYLTEDVALALKNFLDNDDLSGAISYAEANQELLGDQYEEVINWLSNIGSNTTVSLDDEIIE
ncbi:hypothetical protein [Vagococcus xieshaowenii]|uniref:Uncharacterized protein n=1 Tax=Vagococcus xieshaowenii TaxID=2562451 RepID=A0A4Z0D7R6_9ENTE|nr:hypothetical protein [Vagococcus xieshaowenii]QCA29112.1 hypothetical protein E4Z98_07215 [Vagococcus xieshaowenii]TFZ40912.1 hypothetical protein E4031_05880 [Vagococcus xieshaowenii]